MIATNRYISFDNCIGNGTKINAQMYRNIRKVLQTPRICHPKHHQEFAYYLLDQRCVGAQIYHWQGRPVRVYGDFTSHIGNFLQAVCTTRIEGQASLNDERFDAMLSQAERNRQAVGLDTNVEPSTNPTEDWS